MNPNATGTVSPAWWPLLWNSGVLAMSLLGPDRRYQAVNDALCRLLESDADTLLSWSYERVGHPLDLDAELDAFVRLTEGAVSVTYVRRFRTARERELSATVHAIAGADASVLQLILPGVAAVSAPSGISAKTLEQIAAALSHDAQVPVRQMGVTAGLLKECLEPLLETHERERAWLQGIEGNAVRLSRQMRALVRFARLGSPVIAPAPRAVRALVSAACAQVPLPSTITLRDTVAAEMVVRCDPAQVSIALVELLRNAIAPHAPGRPTTVTISAETQGDLVVLSVRDDGVGIVAMDQPRLFRLFAASGPGAGAGVGLALVRAVAEGHGGTVRVESTQGVGTVVSLSLPR
ncbi:MAG TPA: ATP-binding protein [Planctomycetota bacterium]|nr:ATP-binding protein [Planctomycetota bacterium]